MSFNDIFKERLNDTLGDYTPQYSKPQESDNAWKYISSGDVEGLNDYTNKNYNYRDIPFLGQLVGHAADAATQVTADTAQYLNMDGIGNYLNDAAQSGENYLPSMSTPDLSLAYITDPNGLTSAFGQVVGSMLPGAAFARFMPTGYAASRLGGLAGKSPLAGDLLSGLASNGVRWAPTAIPEAMAEGGNTEREMISGGYTPDEARNGANQVFRKNLALLSGTNFLEGGLLGGLHVKVPDVSSNGLLNGLAKGAGYIPSVAAESALQGFEEGEQQGIQNEAEGQPYSYNPFNWTPDQIEQAKFGVAGSIPLIGLSGAARHFSGNNQAHAGSPDEETSDSAGPSYTENNPSEEANTDVSDLPMQNIEDAGLSHTNNALKRKYRELYDWAHDQFGKDMVVSGGWRSP